jgi:IS5 family transposase
VRSFGTFTADLHRLVDWFTECSDEQIEYQVRDRMSFTRFLGLEFEDDIPDGTTLWVFREKLAQAGLVERLFERFNCTSSEHFGRFGRRFKRASGLSGLKVHAAIAC